MASINQLFLVCFLLGLCAKSSAYVVTPQIKAGKYRLVSPSIVRTRTTNASPLFFQTATNKIHVGSFLERSEPKQVFQHLSMSSSNDNTKPDEVKAGDSTAEKKIGSSGADGNLLKNAFLMVPLMAKFIVVLMVKFLTDVVVFPLLFLYRIVRSMKNKLFSFFGSSKPNGESKI